MRFTRRFLLQGALFSAAAVSARAGGTAPKRRQALLVYDSRLPQSHALAQRHAGNAIDLAQEHAHRWRGLRALAHTGTIIGLTRWTDLVQARALLEAQGRRLRTEQRRGELFYWEIG